MHPRLAADATCVGLIPARAGSKRLPGKNIRVLAGHPLLAYAIRSAIDSKVFDEVMVSTDGEDVAETARRYGATVPFLRPTALAADASPDIDWVRHTLAKLGVDGREWDCFAILRPTSPFRRPETIRRAWHAFLDDGTADSLRAVERCTEHPAKMWRIDGARMRPVMTNPDPSATPWHSSPYDSLPLVYVQNASLEIARCDVPLKQGTIAGDEIMPFITEPLEGFDINTAEDWIVAEHYATTQPERLPEIAVAS